MATKVKTGVIDSSAITSALIANASITADDLHATLDLTGKTVTVATATAGDNDTSVASTSFVSTAIANLADSAPSTLNTLNELAAALGDDANYATTTTNAIAAKAPLASPTFTGDVKAAANATGAALIKGVSGNQTDRNTGGYPQYTFVGNQGTGMRRVSENVLSLDAGGAEALRIIADGKVGIGTSSPGAKLDVGGVFQFFDDTTPEIKIIDSDDSNYALLSYSDGTINLSSNHGNESGGANVIKFSTGGTERMRVDSAGTLYQGTTSPTLHSAIRGLVFENGSLLNDVTRGDGKSITLAQNMAIDSGNTWAFLAAGEGSYYQQYNGNHYFGTSLSGTGAGGDATVTTLMKIHKAGNVGIGHNTPYSKLNVQGTSASTYTGAGPGATIRASQSTDGNWIASDVDGKFAYFGIDGNDAKFAAYNYASSAEMGMVLGQNRMYIKSDGNVGIGTNSPAVSLDIGSKTDALRLPSGTTAQRPTAANGQIRYNTSLNKLEAYINGAYGTINTTAWVPPSLTTISGLQVWADVTGGISSTTVADGSGNSRTGTLQSTSEKGTLAGNTYLKAYGSNRITYAAGVLPDSSFATGNATSYFFVCTNRRTHRNYGCYIGSQYHNIIRHTGTSLNYNIFERNNDTYHTASNTSVPVASDSSTISEAYILVFQLKVVSGNTAMTVYKHENGSTTSDSYTFSGTTGVFQWATRNYSVTIGTSSWANEYLDAGIFSWGFTNTDMTSANRQVIYDYYGAKGLAN